MKYDTKGISRDPLSTDESFVYAPKKLYRNIPSDYLLKFIWWILCLVAVSLTVWGVPALIDSWRVR